MPIEAPYYSFEPPKNQGWTVAQEKSIAKDYPLTISHKETPEQFVVRTYIQILWLPQSIAPLNLLVPSLLRVKAASTSDQHPLHTLLEPLLLSVRSTASKYHVELPQILQDGGGAGEIEESMMWYVLGYEKMGRDMSDCGTYPCASDEHLRKDWLDQMERREVQMQILLYMLKLSLPGYPPAEQPEVRTSKKRNRSFKEGTLPVVVSLEDRLESFMDKLSMWQLIGKLDTSIDTKMNQRAEERDWMQIFCEDIVEPQFQICLPELCSLLRSKVFHTSPFSDDSSPSRSPTPDTRVDKTKSRSSSVIGSHPNEPIPRYPSPAPSVTSRVGSVALKGEASSRSLQRSRSRSLSVSLAQEKERAASATSTSTKQRVLNREVSMSRVFKSKKKEQLTTDNSGVISKKTTAKNLPWKGKRRDTTSAQPPNVSKDLGVTLVDATPVKPRVKTKIKVTSGVGQVEDGSNAPMQLRQSQETGKMEEEEIWDLSSSPNIIMLSPRADDEITDSACGFDGLDKVIVAETPTKKRKTR